MPNDCWRCGATHDLVRDPMQNLRYSMRVCRKCAKERAAVLERYNKSGKNIVIQFEPGNT